MSCYEIAKKFKKRYPLTVSWRLKKHCQIIDNHLNPDEKILYLFAGQDNERPIDLFYTCVVAITNKRIVKATKRIIPGYSFKSITPDMYNDLTVEKNIIWGTIIIDTVKEEIKITNIDPKALDEIETHVTEIMIKAKKEYPNTKKEK